MKKSIPIRSDNSNWNKTTNKVESKFDGINPFKHYGFYGWNNNRVNTRFKEFVSDPKIYINEFNYIHDLNIGKTIVEHTKLHFANNHYPNIKSFDFISHSNASENDISKIKELINHSYLTNYRNDSDGKIPYSVINFMRTMQYRGYSYELSKEIMDTLSQQALNINNKLDIDSLGLTIQEKDNIKKILNDVIIRKCDNVHTINGRRDNTMEQKHVIFEDFLISDGKKQLLLGGNDVVYQYLNNDKLLVSPWPNRTIDGDKNKNGYFMWNIVFNKASVSCIFKNSDLLFSSRFILNQHPESILFDNRFKTINDDSTRYIYMGFFIIKYNLDKTTNIINSDNNITLINKVPHTNDEFDTNYFILFIFKDIKDNSYFIINFRCNFIHWGDVFDNKRVLYTEIMQTMALNSNLNNKIYLYTILEKGKSDDKFYNINQLCKNQNNSGFNTILTEKCFYSWFHHDTLQYLKANNLKPETNNNSIQIFVSKYNNEDMLKELKKLENENYFVDNNTIIDKINNKEYQIIECHFDWGTDWININSHKKDRLLLKHNYYEENRRNYINQNLTIPLNWKIIYGRDLYINFYKHMITNYYNNNQKNAFSTYLYEISQNMFDNVFTSQDGGNSKNDKYLDKIKKQIAIYNNNYDVYVKLKENNSEIINNSLVCNIISANVIYNYNKNNIYANGLKINNVYNLITLISKKFINTLNYIYSDRILIISKNIHFADIILTIYSNIIVDLIVIKPFELGSFIELKNKYDSRVNVYFCGNNLDTYLLSIIHDICKNKQYGTIICDIGFSPYIDQNTALIISLFVCKNYLIKNGSFINFCSLSSKFDHTFYLLSLMYKCFNIHNYDNNNCMPNISESIRQTPFSYYLINIFNHFNYSLTLKDEEILNKYLDSYTYLISPDTTYFNDYFNNLILSKSYLKYIYNRLKLMNISNNELLIEIKNNINNKQKGGLLSYHRWSDRNYEFYKIPETINDINGIHFYNEDARDFQPRCHWGQKKLLLSEIQFLTRVYQKVSDFKNYVVLYIGAAEGSHFPILYNMFPDLTWILYDPSKFSSAIMKHPQKDKSVFVYNTFFTDDSINDVKQKVGNKKILYICDMRLTPSEEAVMKDMIDQARWGMQLNADFMYLKFRLPYTDKIDQKLVLPQKINDLNIDKNKIDNPNISTDSPNEIIYLKGDVYLQLYPPIHSTELRLYVEKNKDDKYSLDKYNFTDIENKLFFYNTNLRGSLNLNQKDYPDIIFDDINLIPGYDTSTECLMEYKIINNYFKYVRNKNNDDAHQRTIECMFDMNELLEKLTFKKFAMCNYETNLKTLAKFKDNEKIKQWNKISLLNIKKSAKVQKIIIKKYGLKKLGQDRYNKALKYFNSFTDNFDYYILNINSNFIEQRLSK